MGNHRAIQEHNHGLSFIPKMVSRFPSWLLGGSALFNLSHPARNSVLLINPLRRRNEERRRGIVEGKRRREGELTVQ